MGKRGPKPVDVDQLRFEAYLFVLAFYGLRDGAPALLRHMKGGVWKTRLLPELRAEEIGRPEKVRDRILSGKMSYSPIRYRVKTLTVPPTRKALKDARELVRRSKNWRLTPPVFPKPRLWKRLNKTRSAAEVRKIAGRIRRGYPMLASVLDSHAEDFLAAKRLHNCPKSDRPRSDDKRAQFFSKVLAGLRLGIAPATATKRLSHALLPDSKQIFVRSLEEYASGVFKVPQKGETR
jgi:hypothetical protein